MRGERLRTMSCSDKLARWNVLGLQGCLLSQFVEPIYMSSLTLGALYDAGHLARAVCCRMDVTQDDLPPGFRQNHPLLSRVSVSDQLPRSTEKTTDSSVNWCLGDQLAEVIHGPTGRLPKVSGPKAAPRISKHHLAALFVRTCRTVNRDDLLSVGSYQEAKEAAAKYRQARMSLLSHCRSKSYGRWMHKPVEQEQFSLPSP